jgi:hypothetical protein
MLKLDSLFKIIDALLIGAILLSLGLIMYITLC